MDVAIFSTKISFKGNHDKHIHNSRLVNGEWFDNVEIEGNCGQIRLRNRFERASTKPIHHEQKKKSSNLRSNQIKPHTRRCKNESLHIALD
jgi:hypothetical protein